MTGVQTCALPISVDPTTVVVGEMSVQGLLQKVANLAERLELASDSGAHRVLIPSENKRDLADVPDAVLDRIAAIEPTGPVEWVRSNKHTGVRHAPVALRPH